MNIKNFFSIFAFTLLLLTSSITACRAASVFQITTTTKSAAVSVGTSTTIAYTIKNISPQSFPYVGVNDTSSNKYATVTPIAEGTTCSSFPVFPLNAHDSCVLVFKITGNIATPEKEPFILNPEICQLNPTTYCSRPATEDRVAVTVTAVPPTWHQISVGSPLDGSAVLSLASNNNTAYAGTEDSIYAGTAAGNVFLWQNNIWSNVGDLPIFDGTSVNALVVNTNSIYAGTEAGKLNQWSDNFWFPSSLNTGPINALTYNYFDSANYIGAGPRSGVGTTIYLPANAPTSDIEIMYYNFSPYSFPNTTAMTYDTSTGNTYVGTSNGYVYYGLYDSSDHFGWNEAVLVSGSGSSINALTVDSSAKIYAGTADGVVFIESGGVWDDGTSLGGVPINALAADSSGHVYAGATDGNVFVWNGTSWDAGTSLGDTTVDALVHDNSTNYIYAGLGNGGVDVWNGATWNTIANVQAPSISQINASTYDAAGNLYVGLADGTVYIWNGTEWDNGTSLTTEIQSMTYDSNANKVYAGDTNGRIYYTEGIAWPSVPIASGPINALTFDSNTNQVYIGVAGDIYYGTENTWTFGTSFAADTVTSLAYDTGTQVIYAGTAESYIYHGTENSWSAGTQLLAGTPITALAYAGSNAAPGVIYATVGRYIYSGSE